MKLISFALIYNWIIYPLNNINPFFHFNKNVVKNYCLWTANCEEREIIWQCCMCCGLMLFKIFQTSLIFISLVSDYDNDLETNIEHKKHFGFETFWTKHECRPQLISLHVVHGSLNESINQSIDRSSFVLTLAQNKKKLQLAAWNNHRG